MILTFEGAGLHTGRFFRVTLNTTAHGLSINGRTLSLQKLDGISAQAATRVQTPSGLVWTTEHLLGALAIAHVYDAAIAVQPLEPREKNEELEIPLLDGSAHSFLQALRDVPTRAIIPLTLPHKIEVHRDNAFLVATPCEPAQASIDWTIQFTGGPCGHLALSLSDRAALETVASARTFGFLRDRAALESAGLARGLFSSAVPQTSVAILDETSQDSDEPIRHKVLDFIGDLLLAGQPIAAHFTAYKAGHALHHAWLRALQSALAARNAPKP